MNIILTVDSLAKDFGGLKAVDGLSFTVEEGTMVGLIGPNGCGKSTTFNCISGLLEKTAGEVHLFGKNTETLRPDQIHSLGMTRTFQHTRLWREMTVIENLLIPPRKQFQPNVIKSLFSPKHRKAEELRIQRAWEVLELLEIPHMAHNLASELSGGQSKLVDIGRAMMGQSKILLLDEPVAGVAGPLAERIFKYLRRLVNEDGITLLIIEHNMEFILQAGVDKIVVMHQGKLLMEGTPQQVKNSTEVKEAYLGDDDEEEE